MTLNLLLRLVVRVVGYSPRVQHLFSEVNEPKTIRSKLKEFSARGGATVRLHSVFVILVIYQNTHSWWSLSIAEVSVRARAQETVWGPRAVWWKYNAY